MQPNEPTLQDEARRAARVRRTGLLDTAAERIYDDFARLAAIITGMPIALISLADTDRMWIKAKHGYGGSELPRSIAVCDQTIRQYGLYEIPDLSTDGRFSNRSFVKEDPRLRYYAGMPLTDSEGTNIGVVCVMDTQTHGRMDGDIALALAIISRQVTELIEMRARVNELAEERERLRAKTIQ